MRARRFIAVAILAISLGGPVVEMFDRWDQTLRDGNDTETNVVIVALCVGIALSIAAVIRARIRALCSSLQSCALYISTLPVCPPSLAVPAATARPPTPLRV